jgi:hypothetical protein
MLKTFIQHNDIDTRIIFPQEVVNKGFQCMADYAAHTNIWTERRGTAILTRDTIERTVIEKLPNGTGIEAR